MLFIVKSTHDYSTCQTHHPEKGPLFSETLANLGHHGVKVHAQYSNRLEHVLFIVCLNIGHEPSHRDVQG